MVFMPEEYPLPHPNMLRRVEQTFIQKPTRIPLEIPLMPTRTYVVKQEPNWVPIVAIVGIISLFGLFAFLAFMRKP